MLNIGPQELLIILVIALLVVGPQRLPELGRSIGRGLRELRKAQDEVKRTIQVNLDEPNGDGGARPAPSAKRTPPAPRPTAQDPTPVAGETPTADEVRDISRSLGRSLGQLRRAREEVQRSFRVDLDTSAPPASSNASQPDAASDAPAPANGQPSADARPSDDAQPSGTPEPSADDPVAG